MAKEPSTLDKLIAEFRYNSNSYATFNRNKIQSSLAKFSQKQREAFLLIPYMLQTNSPAKISIIPSKRKAPAGIINFKWGQDVEPLLRKYFGPNVSFNRKDTDKKPQIEFLSLMGSVGSIAYNDQSDFDYWCCISKTMNEIDKGYLQEKLVNIEQWCNSELNVEVHFFITNQKSLSGNNFGEVSKDSCGSAIGKLLKEEYYRGSILVSGKVPYWYIVPMGFNDIAYSKLIDFLENKDEYRSDFIDIGNLDKIPADEFIGGGLWQLNKGVNSPFKSLLKMSLLIVYSDKKMRRPLLANQLKKLIQTKVSQLDDWDAYQNMIDVTLEYYSSLAPQYVELLRQCFFMKIGIKISTWYDSKNLPVQKNDQVILRYCKAWGWDKTTVEKWEYFESLSITEMTSFKKSFEGYMLESLNILHERVDREKVKVPILEEDINRLKNRLLVFYDNSRKSVECYANPFRVAIKSKAYTIRESESKKKGCWNLYKGEHDTHDSIGELEEKNLLRENQALSELLLWMIYNGLIDQKTKLYTSLANNLQLSNNLKILSHQFNEFYGYKKIPDLDHKPFSKKPKTIKWLIAVNTYPQLNESRGLPSDFEEDIETPVVRPLFSEKKPITGKLKKTKTLDNDTSVSKVLQQFKGDKNINEEPTTVVSEIEDENAKGNESVKILPPSEDPLNAWSHSECLLRDCIVFEQNSWGEITAHEYSGKGWLVRLFVKVLNGIQQDFKGVAEMLDICMGQDFYDPNRFKSRIRNLMHSMIEFFFPEGKMVAYEKDNVKVFLIRIHGVCYCVSRDESKYNWFETDNYQKVFLKNNLTYSKKISYCFDKGSSLGRFYQKAVESSQSNRVDIFFQKTNKKVNYITVDKNGKLSVSESTREEMRLYLPKFVYSISLCMKRVEQLYNEKYDAKNENAISIAWYKKDKNIEKMVNITKDTMSIVPKAVKRLTGIEISLKWSDYKSLLNHYISDGRFLFESEEGGAAFTHLVENFKKLRKGSRDNDRDHYPIILTDIQVVLDSEENIPMSTSVWLNIKSTIEIGIAHQLEIKIE